MKKLLVVLCFFASLGAYAATWQLNDDHSEILFKVPYLGVSEVTGRFGEFSGDVEFDDNGHVSKIAISIDASSVDTGHGQRDGHLRAREFFFTQKHPRITFASQSIRQVTPQRLSVSGDLRIRDRIRPLTFDVEFSNVQMDSWKYENRFAKFRFVIKRSEFGLTWNKTLGGDKYLVGDDVTVWGNLQLQPVGKSTPTSKHMIPDTKSIRQRERLNRGEITKADYAASVNGSSPAAEAMADQAIGAFRPTGPNVLLKHDDVRHTTRWQLWFWGLGLMGFFGALVLGLSAKKWVMEKYPEQYAENGWMGHLSDFLSIGLTFIYAVAFWVVGWGT